MVLEVVSFIYIYIIQKDLRRQDRVGTGRNTKNRSNNLRSSTQALLRRGPLGRNPGALHVVHPRAAHRHRLHP